MCDIFLNAQSVQVWLSNVPSLDSSDDNLQTLPVAGESRSYFENIIHYCNQVMAENRPFKKDDYEYAVALCRFIFENPYWQRAWVLQESSSARELTVWINPYLLGLHSLQHLWTSIVQRKGGPDFTYLEAHTSPAVSTPSGAIKAKQHHQYYDSLSTLYRFTGVVETLCHFQDKRCADPRDRVFSLVSLCLRGGSSIEVDYNVSQSRLAYTILTGQNDRICLCTAAVAARTLPTLLGASDGS